MNYLDAFLRDRQPTVQNQNLYSGAPSKPSKPSFEGTEDSFEGFEGSQNHRSSKQTVGCSYPQRPQNPVPWRHFPGKEKV